MWLRTLLTGILIWTGGTAAIRLSGHRLLQPGRATQTVGLYVVSFVLMAFLVPRICRRLGLERDLWPKAATLLILPTLILDPFSCAVFTTMFPNLDPGAAGAVGGGGLSSCGGGAAGAWAKAVCPVTAPTILAADEDLPAPPRQARSLATRKKLLEAGRNLFAEQGYHATSIQTITSRAGTAAGAFYTYFRSKRQLLIVLMNELLERLGDLDLRPKGGADMRSGLRSFLAAVFRADLEYYGVVRAWQEAALTDAGLGQMQTAIESWTHARILGVFRLLQQYPNARPDRDLPTFARMMDRHFWSLPARGASLPR